MSGTKMEQNQSLNVKMLSVPPIGENTYIVNDGRFAFIVDPGGLPNAIIKNASGFEVLYILLTHSHFDHIYALQEVADAFPKAFVCIHRLDRSALSTEGNLAYSFGEDFRYNGRVDIELKDGQMLDFAGRSIKVLHTPGHTEGGVCFYIGSDNILFSGDTLFRSSVGRSDFPGGDAEVLERSIREKLYILPEGTKVYPGHDEPTEIGWERKNNMFVRA